MLSVVFTHVLEFQFFLTLFRGVVCPRQIPTEPFVSGATGSDSAALWFAIHRTSVSGGAERSKNAPVQVGLPAHVGPY